VKCLSVGKKFVLFMPFYPRSIKNASHDIVISNIFSRERSCSVIAFDTKNFAFFGFKALFPFFFF